MGHVCAQAPLLAHAMLHHPRAWPRQETALGLLISLRKFYQTVGVRLCLLGQQVPVCLCVASRPIAVGCSRVPVQACPNQAPQACLCSPAGTLDLHLLLV